MWLIVCPFGPVHSKLYVIASPSISVEDAVIVQYKSCCSAAGDPFALFEDNEMLGAVGSVFNMVIGEDVSVVEVLPSPTITSQMMLSPGRLTLSR